MTHQPTVATRQLKPPGYLQLSARPLASLAFLFPLILIYELRSRMGMAGAPRGYVEHVLAFVWMRHFFGLFGANGKHLPALCVVCVLLAWHIARKDKWTVSIPVVAGMAMESILLIAPLLALGVVFARYFPLAAPEGHTSDMVCLSLGAGVYEEMVFRLFLFTVLHLVLRDGLRLNQSVVCVVMVIGSGLIFSAYHYLSPLEGPFQLRTFAFRAIAGIYFGILMLTRGIGVTAGTHAAYDVIISVLG